MTSFDIELLVEIGLTAELLNDIEAQRKRNTNRRGALTRTEPDSDGVVRGRGFRTGSHAVVLLDAHLAELATQEARMVRLLENVMKQHPLAAWIKSQKGLGLKQMGRLFAAIQDPSWHPVQERPRTLPELNAYCGMVPGYRRVRGVRAAETEQWNAEARMRLYLVAESGVGQIGRSCKPFQDPDRSWIIEHVDGCRCGPYRLVYEQRRRFTEREGKLHSEVCPRCGPKGHPAQPGSPWPKAHQRGDAVRYVGKRILRDLWREARRINGFADQGPLAS
jgi:hypothetical protein